MAARPFLRIAFAAALLATGSSAWASEHGGWRDGRWHGDMARDYPVDESGAPIAYPGAPAEPYFDHPGRDAWLADCRQRIAADDRGAGGAIIGGVVGGVAGNRIAGRGNRTVGTIAGAAVGAVAGAAIDRAEDSRRDRDTCETYLDNYYANYRSAQAPGYEAAQAYGYPAYAPAGYGPGCCASPVMMVPAPVQSQPQCTETVEYIYEDVPVRARTRPAKRTKIVHDKRVRTAGKRISAK